MHQFIVSDSIWDGTNTDLFSGIIEIQGEHVVRVDHLDAAELRLQKEKLDSNPNAHIVPRTLVTPALINGHTHLAMQGLRGISLSNTNNGNLIEDVFFKYESKMTKDDVQAFATVGAYDCLMNGVAFVWDHYYHSDAVAAAMTDVGLCGVVAPTLQDLSGPGMTDWEASLRVTRDIHASQRLRDLGVFAAYGPHATDTVSDHLLRKIFEGDLPVHMHCAQTIQELEASEPEGIAARLIRLGIGLCNQPVTLVHGIYLSKPDLHQLGAFQHIQLVFCQSSQEVFQFPADVSVWTACKIPWTVGTDCAASNDSNNVLRDLRSVWALESRRQTFESLYQNYIKGIVSRSDFVAARKHYSNAQTLSAEALLKKVTSDFGSRIDGFPCGTIAPGYKANLAFWDLDHPAMWPGTHPLTDLILADGVASLSRLMVLGQWRGGMDGPRSLRYSRHYLKSIALANDRLQQLNNHFR